MVLSYQLLPRCDFLALEKPSEVEGEGGFLMTNRRQQCHSRLKKGDLRASSKTFGCDRLLLGYIASKHIADMSQAAPSLLLLIPAYNEERRLEPVLRDYAEYFQTHYAGPFRIVVVLNGCVDDTIGVVRRVGADYKFVSALEFPAPIGKGGALIEGLKLAPQADLIGYVDADGATAPPAFHDLVKHCDQADCVIGSRWVSGAVLHQSQSSRRQFASRVFHAIVQVLFRMNIKDTQCGAKVLHREVVEKIHPALRIADMAFDINLLYAVKRAGFRILEVPTEWTDKIGSKVVLGKTSLTMLLSAIRLRLVYSHIYPLLRPLRPLETWIYLKLKAPPPRPRPDSKGAKARAEESVNR
jgi:glycosyltransferase involved in cell wall biosynthesis